LAGHAWFFKAEVWIEPAIGTASGKTC